MNSCGRIGGDGDLSDHGLEVCFCHCVIDILDGIRKWVSE